MYKEPITTGIALVLTIRKVGKLHKTIFQMLGCRELGIRKVEKRLQTRLSTRAEHSCKRDVQLRILCSRGKRTFLAHKDVSLIPQKEQTQGQNGFQVDKEVPPNKVLAAVNKSR